MGMERGRRSRISTGTPEEGEQRGLEYIEYIPFFNLSHDHKCPFGSLLPPTPPPCPNSAPASLDKYDYKE